MLENQDNRTGIVPDNVNRSLWLVSDGHGDTVQGLRATIPFSCETFIQIEGGYCITPQAKEGSVSLHRLKGVVYHSTG